jgi:hypothetical protein
MEALKGILWKQFGATIDMLENAIDMCTSELWHSDKEFWYSAYHAIFYLDYYLSEELDDLMPPEPFGLSEFDPAGLLPERI